jgi:prepilin-type N-terminal cleavage/methylation domain-containing protein
MNKKGFTLIELMVVVVIIGILAAVAVPKLFGMIAKSKASEVGPAAGTYVKMQQAYISEAAMVGNWLIIGYKGPGSETAKGSATGGSTSETTNFKYADATSFSDNTVAIGTAVTGFTAQNVAKLNDCGANSSWTISVSGTAGDSDATFTATPPSSGCEELTPTFKTIGN